MIVIEWKSIDGYEGYYEVSDDGRVRSLNRDIVAKNGVSYHLTGKEMKLTKTKGRDNDGYYVVNLRKHGCTMVVPVHVLVAKAFISNPHNLPTVNHKDGNKANNNKKNLEWASYSENNNHALLHKLRKPRGNPIIQKTLDGETVACYRSTCEAFRMTGVSIGSISHCLNHRTNTAGGFVWEKVVGRCNDYPDFGSTSENELLVEVQEQQKLKI